MLVKESRKLKFSVVSKPWGVVMPWGSGSLSRRSELCQVKLCDFSSYTRQKQQNLTRLNRISMTAVAVVYLSEPSSCITSFCQDSNIRLVKHPWIRSTLVTIPGTPGGYSSPGISIVTRAIILLRICDSLPDTVSTKTQIR
jgi:hypothetical protein